MRTSWFDIIVPSLVSIAGALVMTTSCSPAYAQQRVATTYQYSAKTLCTLAPDIGFGDAFAPGGYRTVINIHNPSDRKIEIARKFALAIQPGEASGPFTVTPYKSLSLEPDQAVAYNCFDISNFYCPIGAATFRRRRDGANRELACSAPHSLGTGGGRAFRAASDRP